MKIPVIGAATTSNTNFPTYVGTTEEAAIREIAGVTGWFEPSERVEADNGFRLYDRLSDNYAAPLYELPPVLLTGSHGETVIRTSYGSDPIYSARERGALRPKSRKALLGTDGFTVYSVIRIPTVASGEATLPGGTSWASQGVASSALPNLRISDTTGIPAFQAGGSQIVNPGGGIDIRDGNWHIIKCTWDRIAGTVKLEIDRARKVGTNTGATTAIDTTYPNALSPIMCGQLRDTGFWFPLYGDTAMLLFRDVPAASGDDDAVYTYVASKFDVVLV